ncbi:MAG: IS256 family transposase [Casimicrobiaceae bacterium]|nr:IS256 family transposase [Casimicrobiaceae bacterium]
MREKNTVCRAASTVCFETIEAHARAHIQQWLQHLLEAEVTEFLGRAKSQRRAAPQRCGYRNGYGRPRRLALSSGTITLRRPRMRNLARRFESRVLPLFRRRSAELGALLPQLYLHGLSSGDFELALRGLLGEGAPLSAASLARLKGVWQTEYETWKRTDLSALELVYWWADGLYVKAGIADRRAALLVIVGATAQGNKVLLACQAGERESAQAWAAVLRDLRARGLAFPRLTVADGNLGIWAALGELHPAGDEQRCWNHKILNVLDALPKKAQAEARERLRAMMYAESRSACERARDAFLLRYRKTDPRACATLTRDWARLVAFFDYPREHWIHLRTTNIVESPFDPVRLRTNAARRFKKTENAEAMIWKLLRVAEQSWRALNAPHRMREVYNGTRFKDGIAIASANEPTRKAA